MDKLLVNSFAKINIGLNIVSKRDDGFHNIETIFYPINLFDELTFTKSNEFSFFSNDENLNKEKTNLIIKSKELLESVTSRKFNVNIKLSKKVPIGAGLGGGSSNAAATLLALNELFDLKLNTNILAELALKLGSDVPFFLNPIPAFAESRGEIISPLTIKLNKHLLIVNPGIHISTKWAFGLIRPILPEISLKSFIGKSTIILEDILQIASNDFEKVVFEHFEEIKEIKYKMLELGAIYSMMTGTGSTVWGIFNDEETANQAESYFKRKNYFTFIQSPI